MIVKLKHEHPATVLFRSHQGNGVLVSLVVVWQAKNRRCFFNASGGSRLTLERYSGLDRDREGGRYGTR
jgi:hypothetical protein